MLSRVYCYRKRSELECEALLPYRFRARIGKPPSFEPKNDRSFSFNTHLKPYFRSDDSAGNFKNALYFHNTKAL